MSPTKWCWLSRDPVSKPAEALPICCDADTMMPQPPALPLLPSWGFASDWCGCTLADTLFVLDCTAGVEIAAICSNSPVISICMRTWAIRSPLHKAQVLYLMPLITSLQVPVYASTSLLVLVPKSGLAYAAEKSIEKRKGFYFPQDVKIYEKNPLIKECWTSTDGVI